MAKKFEYKVFNRYALLDEMEEGISDTLAQLGQEGWEMAGVVPDKSITTTYVFFKREIDSQNQS